tara:strand:- start:1884 stop:2684 length:801 start_codon:yes stop_codon:yes gene_type:complete
MINKEKKYLFIRIPKTASSTLRIALGEQNFSNFNDGAMKIGFSSERINPAPSNQEPAEVKSKYIDFLNFTNASKTDIHARYIEWNKKVDSLDNYFVFSFVRNPWDWMVSQYTFLKKIYIKRLRRERQGKPAVKDFYIQRRENFSNKLSLFGISFSDFKANPDCLSFEKYIEAYFSSDDLNKTQLGFIINESSEIALDFVGKFESLQDDWNSLCDKINLSPVNLEQTNASLNRKPYTEYYSSPAIKKIVDDGLKDDIEHFGYEFGNL